MHRSLATDKRPNAQVSALRRPGSFAYRAWDALARWSGRPVLRPFVSEMLHDQWLKDVDENAELDPGTDELVEIYAIWAVDFIIPSNIEAVADAMTRQSWNVENRMGTEADLVGWIRRMRGRGARGHHSTTLTRPEERRFTTSGHDARLPSFAQQGWAIFECLTPAVTAVAVCFVMKETERRQVDAAIRAAYRSRARPIGVAVQIVTPEIARKEAVVALREGWRREIGGWFRAHVPGLLSATKNDADLVTCELAITDSVSLFAVNPTPADKRTSDLVEGRFSAYTFDQEAHPHATFADQPCRAPELASHSILTIRRSDFEVDTLNPNGGFLGSLAGAHRAFQRTFLLWSALDLLAFYERAMNAARESASSMLRSLLPVRTLRRLRAVMTTLADSAVVAREMLELAGSGEMHVVEGYDLRWRPLRPKDSPRSIREVIRSELERRTARLQAANAELQGSLSTQANLISASANLWLQVIVGAFAVVSLIFSGISAYYAYADHLADQHGRMNAPPAVDGKPSTTSANDLRVRRDRGGRE